MQVRSRAENSALLKSDLLKDINVRKGQNILQSGYQCLVFRQVLADFRIGVCVIRGVKELHQSSQIQLEIFLSG